MRIAAALRRILSRSGLVLAIGTVTAGDAVASDWYVDINAPSGGDGSQAHPFQKIQSALTSSSDGDRIHVSPGTYSEFLTVQTSVTILGQLGATTTISTISSLPTKGTPLTISPGKNVWLQDLTFTGWSNFDGGGIKNAGTSVAVRCYVTGCFADGGGGGVYNTGTLVMWGCVVNHCVSYGTPGGGIWNTGTLKLFSCFVGFNTAFGQPGSGGSVGAGGGIYSSSYPITPDVSDLRLVNVTVCGNRASGDQAFSGGYAYGGGIVAFGKAWIDHSTVSSNVATSAYTGFGGDGGGYAGAEADVTHSIFADNISDYGADFEGVCNSHGYLLILDTDKTSLQGDMTGVQTGIDPKLLRPADNGGLVPTQALDPTSPCIDTGNPDPLASPAYDARGYPRALWDPAVGPSDLGAYEYGSAISFLLTATPDVPLASGAKIALTTGGGIGSNPFALVLVEVNGNSLFTPVVVSTFDQSGVFLLEATVPPGLSGLTAGFRSFSLDGSDKLEQTNEALLTFQ